MFFKNKNNTNIPKSHRAAWIVSAGVFLVLAVGTILWSYVPQPTLDVPMENGRVPLDASIRVDFSIPVSREMNVSITPETFGETEYSRYIYQDRLARTLTFRPEVTWLPDTTYQIKITGIKSAWPSYRQPRTIAFSFTTAAVPTVISVTPSTDDELSPDAVWQISYDQPSPKGVTFTYAFSPEMAFDASTTSDGTVTILKPSEPLSQGTTYQLTAYQHVTQYYTDTDDVAHQGDPTSVLQDSWTVREAPGVVNVSPSGDTVGITDPIVVTFTQAMDAASFSEHAHLDPETDGDWRASGDTQFTFQPAGYAPDTAYRLTLAKGMKNSTGGFLTEDATYAFTTIGPVHISQTLPADTGGGVGVNSAIRMTFDQPVDHESAQAHFSINPGVSGDFTWDGNTLIFQPVGPLSFNTGYTVRLSSGVKGRQGFDLVSDYAFAFTTELSVTKLNVAYNHQDHNLSCEVAALVMALTYKGVNVTETPLINAIGFDPTPKSNGVWGNPNVAFVGDIDGHQPSTGYGVYWDPVATAAQAYRPATAFSGWTVAQLTAEIKKGNPVVIWGTAGSGTRIDWKTPQGGNVVAINGEHARVAIGFIGSAENPTKIITMDPLVGEKYFTISSFEWNWGLLGNSGVVVE